jgi:hypothetical protein
LREGGAAAGSCHTPGKKIPRDSQSKESSVLDVFQQESEKFHPHASSQV